MSKLRTIAKKAKRPISERRPKKVAEQKPIPEIAAKSKVMKISAEVLAFSRHQQARILSVPELTFRPAEPVPGALPRDAKTMAHDAQIKKNSKWAADSVTNSVLAIGGWGGWGGQGYGAFAEGQAFLGYPYLSELAQRPEYRLMVETISTEMTRKWIKISASGDEGKAPKVKQLTAELERLQTKEAFEKADQLDGYFGRGHIFLDFTGSTEDGKLEELKTPVGDGLNEITQQKISGAPAVAQQTNRQVKRGTPPALSVVPTAVATPAPKVRLERLQIVEPVWSYPTNYNSNNPLRADWYTPQMWFAMSTEVHSSRFLTMISREVPDLLKPAYSFGGLSLTQMAKPYVDNWLRTRQSVSDLVHSFTVWCIATNMGEVLTPGGEQLFNRIALFNNLRDNKGVMLTDKDTEELSNVSVPLSTLDTLQAQSQEHMCSVSRIPLVKFTGISPAGLNASSEGELRVFYDMISARQNKLYRPLLDRIFRFAQINLWGAVDPDLTYEFEELWSLDDKQKAEVRKIEADTDAVLEGVGAIDGMEIRQRVAAERDSPHASLDLNKIIEKPVEEDPFGNKDDEGGDPDDENQDPPEGETVPKPGIEESKPAKPSSKIRRVSTQ